MHSGHVVPPVKDGLYQRLVDDPGNIGQARIGPARPQETEVETRHLRYGDQRIAYRVVRSARRHKTISIRILPDGSVQVAAPVTVPDSRIDALVQRRADWIRRHIRQTGAFEIGSTPRRYASGENHLYLGRAYPLNIHIAKKIYSNVKISNGQLEITTPRSEPEAIRRLLMCWYRERASEVFARRLEVLLTSLFRDQAASPTLRLRTMKRRWGSCSSRGIITLNPHLVKAPAECIDYVISHELCHLKVFNHSPRFYRLLDQVLPGWQITKAKLDGMAAALLNT